MLTQAGMTGFRSDGQSGAKSPAFGMVTWLLRKIERHHPEFPEKNRSGIRGTPGNLALDTIASLIAHIIVYKEIFSISLRRQYFFGTRQ